MSFVTSVVFRTTFLSSPTSVLSSGARSTSTQASTTASTTSTSAAAATATKTASSVDEKQLLPNQFAGIFVGGSVVLLVVVILIFGLIHSLKKRRRRKYAAKTKLQWPSGSRFDSAGGKRPGRSADSSWFLKSPSGFLTGMTTFKREHKRLPASGVSIVAKSNPDAPTKPQHFVNQQDRSMSQRDHNDSNHQRWQDESADNRQTYGERPPIPSSVRIAQLKPIMLFKQKRTGLRISQKPLPPTPLHSTTSQKYRNVQGLVRNTSRKNKAKVQHSKLDPEHVSLMQSDRQSLHSDQPSQKTSVQSLRSPLIDQKLHNAAALASPLKNLVAKKGDTTVVGRDEPRLRSPAFDMAKKTTRSQSQMKIAQNPTQQPQRQQTPPKQIISSPSFPKPILKSPSSVPTFVPRNESPTPRQKLATPNSTVERPSPSLQTFSVAAEKVPNINDTTRRYLPQDEKSWVLPGASPKAVSFSKNVSHPDELQTDLLEKQKQKQTLEFKAVPRLSPRGEKLSLYVPMDLDSTQSAKNISVTPVSATSSGPHYSLPGYYYGDLRTPVGTTPLPPPPPPPPPQSDFTAVQSKVMVATLPQTPNSVGPQQKQAQLHQMQIQEAHLAASRLRTPPAHYDDKRISTMTATTIDSECSDESTPPDEDHESYFSSDYPTQGESALIMSRDRQQRTFSPVSPVAASPSPGMKRQHQQRMFSPVSPVTASSPFMHFSLPSGTHGPSESSTSVIKYPKVPRPSNQAVPRSPKRYEATREAIGSSSNNPSPSPRRVRFSSSAQHVQQLASPSSGRNLGLKSESMLHVYREGMEIHGSPSVYSPSSTYTLGSPPRSKYQDGRLPTTTLSPTILQQQEQQSPQMQQRKKKKNQRPEALDLSLSSSYSAGSETAFAKGFIMSPWTVQALMTPHTADSLLSPIWRPHIVPRRNSSGDANLEVA